MNAFQNVQQITIERKKHERNSRSQNTIAKEATEKYAHCAFNVSQSIENLSNLWRFIDELWNNLRLKRISGMLKFSKILYNS